MVHAVTAARRPPIACVQGDAAVPDSDGDDDEIPVADDAEVVMRTSPVPFTSRVLGVASQLIPWG